MQQINTTDIPMRRLGSKLITRVGDGEENREGKKWTSAGKETDWLDGARTTGDSDLGKQPGSGLVVQNNTYKKVQKDKVGG